MNNNKIYSRPDNPQASLFYYQTLEDEDIVTDDCKLRFGSEWTPISKDSAWINKTLREVKKEVKNDKLIIAKRFDNIY